jgi:hypothetical protein
MYSETAMKRMGIISSVAVSCMLLAAGPALAGPEAPRTIDLRPQWKQGDAFYIEWESTSKNVWTQEGTFDCWVGHTHDRFGFILRVEAVQPGDAMRIELTFDRMASAFWWGDDQEQGDAWDSDADPPDAPSKLRTVTPTLHKTEVVAGGGAGISRRISVVCGRATGVGESHVE